MESPTVTHPSDLSLALRVVLGSLESWHTFVLRYSALTASIPIPRFAAFRVHKRADGLRPLARIA
jgi:hypothetical protein